MVCLYLLLVININKKDYMKLVKLIFILFALSRTLISAGVGQEYRDNTESNILELAHYIPVYEGHVFLHSDSCLNIFENEIYISYTADYKINPKTKEFYLRGFHYNKTYPNRSNEKRVEEYTRNVPEIWAEASRSLFSSEPFFADNDTIVMIELYSGWSPQRGSGSGLIHIASKPQLIIGIESEYDYNKRYEKALNTSPDSAANMSRFSAVGYDGLLDTYRDYYKHIWPPEGEYSYMKISSEMYYISTTLLTGNTSLIFNLLEQKGSTHIYSNIPDYFDIHIFIIENREISKERHIGCELPSGNYDPWPSHFWEYRN